jgi:hypothetical protein
MQRSDVDDALVRRGDEGGYGDHRQGFCTVAP